MFHFLRCQIIFLLQLFCLNKGLGLTPEANKLIKLKYVVLFYSTSVSVPILASIIAIFRLPSVCTNCEAQARVRQGSARDGSQGERPQSLNPCQELTLKLVATFHHHP